MRDAPLAQAKMDENVPSDGNSAALCEGSLLRGHMFHGLRSGMRLACDNVTRESVSGCGSAPDGFRRCHGVDPVVEPQQSDKSDRSDKSDGSDPGSRGRG